MEENNTELTFPTIKFPILTDLQVNASELAMHYGMEPPASINDITTIILTNLIVNMFCTEKIAHRPDPDGDENIDIKGACFLYVIATAMCRVLGEQGTEVDLMEIYGKSGNAIFQDCPEGYVSMVLDKGQSLGERFYEEALTNSEINEFVLFVMSFGLLYSIEQKGETLSTIVSLFEQIKDI